MALVDTLRAARDQAAANLQLALTSPRPNYSIDGESVSWSDYTDKMQQMIEKLQKQINSLSPYIVTTRQVL